MPDFTDRVPNYWKYTLAELRDVEKHVNRVKYPDRFAMIQNEIESRLRDAKDDDGHLPTKSGPIVYGGFWRRLGADLIDALLLSPLSFAVIFVTVMVNPWLMIPMQLLAAAINAAYTTVLHARVGATIGKLVTGLSVRKLDLSAIGWDEAVLRSSVDYGFIVIGWIGNVFAFFAIPRDLLQQATTSEALQLLVQYTPSIFVLIQTLFALWYWSEVVVLLFNSKKRALHDFIAKTVVVVTSSVPDYQDGGEVA